MNTVNTKENSISESNKMYMKDIPETVIKSIVCTNKIESVALGEAKTHTKNVSEPGRRIHRRETTFLTFS